jgi:osmoprotectant transport system permease protein
MEWAAKNVDFVLQLSLTHLLISLVPLFLGSVFAFALVRLTPAKLAGTIGTTFSAIYAIPSLAIFVALPAVIGTSYLGPTNVVIALSVYVAASMFFSTRDAFSQVPKPAVFIARAQGLSPFQLFVHVELPLAIPGLIAGLRVAAASTVSMASIGAIVGVRNLGYLFLDGFQRKIPEEILTGLVAIFLIGIALDIGLMALGKVLTPWTRRPVQHA